MILTTTNTPDNLATDDLKDAYLRHWKRLRSALKKNVGSCELADDAMQETWLRLSSMRQPAAPIEDRQAYLLRLAANIAIDLIRKENRHSTRCVSDDALLLAIADSNPSPEVIAVDRDQLRQLAGALAQLSPKTCAALLMSRCDGLTHREIAASLKISERAVATHLVRAMRHCRDHFRKLV